MANFKFQSWLTLPDDVRYSKGEDGQRILNFDAVLDHLKDQVAKGKKAEPNNTRWDFFYHVLSIVSLEIRVGRSDQLIPEMFTLIGQLESDAPHTTREKNLAVLHMTQNHIRAIARIVLCDRELGKSYSPEIAVRVIDRLNEFYPDGMPDRFKCDYPEYDGASHKAAETKFYKRVYEQVLAVNKNKSTRGRPKKEQSE